MHSPPVNSCNDLINAFCIWFISNGFSLSVSLTEYLAAKAIKESITWLKKKNIITAYILSLQKDDKMLEIVGRVAF